jgi:ribosomal protein S18 acetylase RimI-like enzyme
MTIKIRTCTLDDIHTLRELAYVTFEETFRDQNTEEAMRAYLDSAFTLEQLEKELVHPASRFYFVVGDGHVAGYLKVNADDAQTEPMGPDALEIQRIYIRKEYQKLGLGRLLYHKAMKVAKEWGKKKVWLGVWERNENALAFYRKMGFEQTGAHSFYMGDEEQTDYIMTKVLD